MDIMTENNYNNADNNNADNNNINNDTNNTDNTEKARSSIKNKKIVITAGTFDILHPGHYDTLKYAKSLGDELIVIIARDETVKKIKGRKPIIPEEQRKAMVEAIKPVDKAILGSLTNKLEPILRIKPNYIVLGPDQTTFEIQNLKMELNKYGLNTEVVKSENYTKCPFHSSYDIVKEIVKRWCNKELEFDSNSKNSKN